MPKAKADDADACGLGSKCCRAGRGNISFGPERSGVRGVFVPKYGIAVDCGRTLRVEGSSLLLINFRLLAASINIQSTGGYIQ
jgi:hypothetical protein